MRYEAAVIILAGAAALAGCQPKAPAANPLEGVYRSEHVMRSAVDVGLSFQRHSELLQELAAEVAIAQERATTDQHKSVAQAYVAAVDVYRDAQALWKAQIDSADYAQQLGVGAGNILANKALTELAAKYGGQPMESKGLPEGWSAIPADVMQKVWAAADEKGRQAATQYLALK